MTASARPSFIPLVAGGRLPLAFMGVGLMALMGAALVLARAAGTGSPWLTPLQPTGVLVAHLWVPAGLLSLCIGAVYQLSPVILGSALQQRPWALWLHLGLHTLALTQLVFGFATGRPRCITLGGLGVASGLLLFAWAVLRTFLASTRRDAAAWSLPFATGWMLLTALSGAALGLQKWQGLFWVPAEDLLVAHLHFGIVGFFGTLLLGVTFQLYPMFTLGEARLPHYAKVGLFLAQGGLAGFGAGRILGWTVLDQAGLVLLLSGLVYFGTAFVATHRSRRRQILDTPLRAFTTGLSLIPFPALTGFGLGITGREVEGAPSFYVVLLVGGVLSLTILGMLAKILPFLVWMRVYGPLTGRRAIPRVTELGHGLLDVLWFVVHLAALAAAASAAVADSAFLATGAAGLFSGAFVIYGANALLIVRHLLRSPLPTSPTHPCLAPPSHERCPHTREAFPRCASPCP